MRGVYPLGMSATNSGVTPRPGFSYSNLLAIYSRDQFRGPNGEIVATGNQSVVMDLNSIVWVSRKEILGGAKFSLSATLPVANNSLTSDVTGPVGASTLTHRTTSVPVIGPTSSHRAKPVWLTQNKRTAISAFQMYEFHTTQEETQIKPGQTLNLDYSLTHLIPLGSDLSLQIGLAGYNQWQTTDKTGPTITPEQAAEHYRVNALGFAANVNMPARVNVGVKYFKEFLNRSTFQGYSFQLSGAISF